MKKIYIAGKIRGECETPELMQKCINKFDDYGTKLIFNQTKGNIYPLKSKFIDFQGNEEMGYTHGLNINHYLINSVKGGTWDQYMKNDISVLIQCDEAHFLPCWKDSRGAKIEHQLCLDLGIKIVYADIIGEFNDNWKKMDSE